MSKDPLTYPLLAKPYIRQRLSTCRLAQAEEYGQPQEAATWDFLSLMYVQPQTSQASIAEVELSSVPDADVVPA